MKIIFGFSVARLLSNEAWRAEASAAAVFPIPVGAAARRNPPSVRVSIPSEIISYWDFLATS